MNQIQPTLALAEPPAIPDQYHDTIVAALRLYWNKRRWEMQESFGFHNLPHLTDDQLLKLPIAGSIAEIARCAAGEPVPEWIGEGIQSLMEALFSSSLLSSYHIPPSFWGTPLGGMVGKAFARIRGDDLITISQAAEVLGVSISAVSNRVDRGHLQAYYDPEERNPQKRRRVLRSEVETLRK
jgi:hypothetical protein